MRGHAERLVDRFHTAQSATRTRNQAARSAFQPLRIGGGNLDLQLDAVTRANHVDAFDTRSIIDNAFGTRKADGQVFEVSRCAHHHHVRAAVVDESDRNLFGNDRRFRYERSLGQPDERAIGRRKCIAQSTQRIVSDGHFRPSRRPHRGSERTATRTGP